jgi:ABC-2 type transport system permease protein
MTAVLARELRRIATRPREPLLLLVLPALALVLTYAIFSAGLPRELPVAVVDQDHSRLSRQLVRMIDATPTVRVAARPADPEEAKALVLQGRVYAWVQVPAGLERDVKRGAAEPVVAYTNAQLLVPASLVKRDLMAATSTLSAGLKLRRLRAAGETEAAARARVEPVRADIHPLYNPQLNYVSYLFVALFPTLLHVFVLVAAVNSVGAELREGTAADWLAAGRGSLARALAGKLLPSTLAFTAVAGVAMAVLFRQVGVPMRGSLGLLLAGTVLFVLAHQATGVALVALFPNLRFATSVAAFLASPAFAYAGVTFPTMAMPVFARAWGELLPLTHYLRLLVEQSMKGAPFAVSAPPALALFAFTVALPPLVWRRMRRVASDARFWGRT